MLTCCNEIEDITGVAHDLTYSSSQADLYKYINANTKGIKTTDMRTLRGQCNVPMTKVTPQAPHTCTAALPCPSSHKAWALHHVPHTRDPPHPPPPTHTQVMQLGMAQGEKLTLMLVEHKKREIIEATSTQRTAAERRATAAAADIATGNANALAKAALKIKAEAPEANGDHDDAIAQAVAAAAAAAALNAPGGRPSRGANKAAAAAAAAANNTHA
jgi:hypothetical protein